MKESTFRAELWLPRAPEELFPFFADAANLEAITPPILNFHTLTPQPIRMQAGTLIDYKLRIRGFPVRWRTRITAWDPPRRFVDEQIRGPYRQWIHEHTFVSADGGTMMTDFVRYVVPGGRLVDRFFVRPDVERIFEFRKNELLRRFT